MVSNLKLGSLALALRILCCLVPGITATYDVDLPISAKTSTVEADNSVVYHASTALLIGNDDSAATGGFHVWALDSSASPLTEVLSKTTGRAELVAVVYGTAGKDLVLTVSQPDSVMRVYDAHGFGEIPEAATTVLGEWSALCPWKSPESGNQYLYLLGKKQAVQYLIRQRERLEIVEIQTFDLPAVASSCAVSQKDKRLYFSTAESATVYGFKTAETTTAPEAETLFAAVEDVAGLAVYAGKASDYLFVAQEDLIAVYAADHRLVGRMKLSGAEDIEIEGGLALFQGTTEAFPAGALTYAMEDSEGTAFGVSSLEKALAALQIEAYDAFDANTTCSACEETVCSACSMSGFCAPAASATTCSCFAGFTGDRCQEFSCKDDCAGHGQCIAANQCACQPGWGGLFCSVQLVEPTRETDALAGDGRDPAIWISPSSPDQSRIVASTASPEGGALAVFDLAGKLLQTLPGGEPNSVDVIYNFTLANGRSLDLVYAACTANSSLCFFEISADGTLSDLDGGTQPVEPDFEVYASCAFRSASTGTQYLFVSNETSGYLQYALTSNENGRLATKLVRQFSVGAGGQTEGCVADEAHGFIFVGEELEGLWRYEVEPADEPAPHGVKVASVATYPRYQRGDLLADVEGVTLVPGKTAADGLLIVSCQGVSAYNVYERAPPHAFVKTFAVTGAADGSVDRVSSTEGIAAVGKCLNAQFPAGLVVLHDDANELAAGGTAEETTFKLVSLKDVLGDELLAKIDPDWDPRA